MCGDTDYTDFLEVTNGVNIFKRPRDPWFIDLSIKLHNTYIEICNDVIKS